MTSFHRISGQACCGNFDRKQLLGHGGFGEVYRGRLNDQDVAVKRILEEKRWQIDSEVYQRNVNQAITELQTMHSYRAENILTLLAISFDPTLVTDPCLVYQFMPNGSVADRLKRWLWLSLLLPASSTNKPFFNLEGEETPLH